MVDEIEGIEKKIRNLKFRLQLIDRLQENKTIFSFQDKKKDNSP